MYPGHCTTRLHLAGKCRGDGGAGDHHHALGQGGDCAARSEKDRFGLGRVKHHDDHGVQARWQGTGLAALCLKQANCIGIEFAPQLACPARRQDIAMP